MTTLLAILLLVTTPPGAHDAAHGGVRIRTSILSNVYTWEVTNDSAAPITSFEVPAHNMYTPKVPPGWQHNRVDEAEVFRAWTDDPRSAIGPGQTQSFAATVTIGNAVIGHEAATIGAGDATITVPGVWAARAKPRSQIALVALMLLGVGLYGLRRQS